jgi:hypothetical protein
MVEASGETNLSPANSTDPSSTGAPTDNKIYINNITMLEQIGVENDFPSNGSYELTADLDGSSFAKTISMFSGGCHLS